MDSKKKLEIKKKLRSPEMETARQTILLRRKQNSKVTKNWKLREAAGVEPKRRNVLIEKRIKA